jgi:hypothetical protein
MQEDKNQYQGTKVVDDNILAEQEYYYEDGRLYVVNKNGYSIISSEGHYIWDFETYPRGCKIPFPVPYEGDEIVSVTFTYVKNSTE